ncbi:MAG: hypothetical protein Fur0021_12530 [Candidatus Promineifilaceae bacterium]
MWLLYPAAARFAILVARPGSRFSLIALLKRPAEFVEPFAGGAIVGLSVAFEQLADRVTLVELDEQVAGIIYGDYKWLANRIISFNLNLENVENILGQTQPSCAEQAFQTMLRKRTNRGEFWLLAPEKSRLAKMAKELSPGGIRA